MPFRRSSAADVISNRDESGTAVQVSPVEQAVAAVSVKLPVSDVSVVPEPLPTLAIEGLIENVQPDVATGKSFELLRIRNPRQIRIRVHIQTYRAGHGGRSKPGERYCDRRRRAPSEHASR